MGPAHGAAAEGKAAWHGCAAATRCADGIASGSTIGRREPTEFPLNGVIAWWTEGVQHMTVGEKVQLVCPPELAYGNRNAGPIPPGSTLNFEVELLAINGK